MSFDSFDIEGRSHWLPGKPAWYPVFVPRRRLKSVLALPDRPLVVVFAGDDGQPQIDIDKRIDGRTEKNLRLIAAAFLVVGTKDHDLIPSLLPPRLRPPK